MSFIQRAGFKIAGKVRARLEALPKLVAPEFQSMRWNRFRTGYPLGEAFVWVEDICHRYCTYEGLVVETGRLQSKVFVERRAKEKSIQEVLARLGEAMSRLAELQVENKRLHDDLPDCGDNCEDGWERRRVLQKENARLREQRDRLYRLAVNWGSLDDAIDLSTAMGDEVAMATVCLRSGDCGKGIYSTKCGALISTPAPPGGNDVTNYPGEVSCLECRKAIHDESK